MTEEKGGLQRQNLGEKGGRGSGKNRGKEKSEVTKVEGKGRNKIN
jgi:hypothetical protein